MARNKGSDTLFKLIHSLSTEEKGYFKKFARRHSTTGTRYLSLFDAISNQEEFDERPLKKKFASYAEMKVYLKEIIMDSLALYYRKSHSHIQLFSQIERIHVLLTKGFYREANKELDKALEISRRMEIFTIERYLLRMQRKIAIPALPLERTDGWYKEATGQNWEKESNQTEWELRVTEWFPKTVKFAENFGSVSGAEIERMAALPALSANSKIDYLLVLLYMYSLNGNSKKCYEMSKEHIKVAREFKRHGDPNSTDIFAMNNHVRNCLQLGYFNEALKVNEELIKNNQDQSFRAEIARLRAYLASLFIYLDSGRFEEGLRFIRSIENDLLAIAKRQADEGRQLTFGILKASVLVHTKNYQEGWMVLQGMKFKGNSEIVRQHYAKWVEACLMVQLGMKNFDIVNKIARKETATFARLKIKEKRWDMNFDFYKQVTALNFKELSQAYSKTLLQYVRSKEVHIAAAREVQVYAYWLDEISGGKTVKQHFAEDQAKEKEVQGA